LCGVLATGCDYLPGAASIGGSGFRGSSKQPKICASVHACSTARRSLGPGEVLDQGEEPRKPCNAAGAGRHIVSAVSHTELAAYAMAVAALILLAMIVAGVF
jgi:hypothetical protein